MEYEAWQERVIKEKDELDDRRFKLGAYLKEHSVDLDNDAHILMEKQYDVMGEYLDILKARIAKFNK